MASNFEMVVDFNTQFGVLQPGELKPKSDILEKDPATVQRCMKLVREEMAELEKAVIEKDFVETVDALADIIFVAHGMSCGIGVNMDDVFNIVYKSNMSKLCKNEDEAKETVKYYIDNKEKLGYDSPTYRKAPDNINWVVYNESTKKVLKSIYFNPPDLSYLLKN